MTDDSRSDTSKFPWPPLAMYEQFRDAGGTPAAFFEQLQEAGDTAAASQAALFEELMSAGEPTQAPDLGELRRFSTGAAMFKTHVQSGGRITVPDAEREALGIDEGDLVQAIVIPLRREDDSS